MADPEIDAMSALATALGELEDDARGRVLRWAAERYGVTVNGSTGGRRGSDAGSDTDSPDSGITDEQTGAEPPAYEHFADLFSKANPKTDPDKALVAAYWSQAVEGASTWQAATLQKNLKNLGHVVGNITTALSSNMDKKPQRIVQLQKSGNSKQGRKTYKVTHAGLIYVQDMLRGESA
ncbi:hypothetical protein [Mycolicibacterium septicum]|uniref:hypothetical protein n=1 Tax=Mycolicibacterium septicum TaxID=98668 RepID=UPI001AF2C03C|nr:hypothetical protein [Mycolicibacterium septicum]QRY51400.1 hypothetical protein JVX95_29000 [Mycolicibacterium septicum]